MADHPTSHTSSHEGRTRFVGEASRNIVRPADKGFTEEPLMDPKAIGYNESKVTMPKTGEDTLPAGGKKSVIVPVKGTGAPTPKAPPAFRMPTSKRP